MDAVRVPGAAGDTRHPASRRLRSRAPQPGQCLPPVALRAVAGFGVALRAFPVIWGLLTSFKAERDGPGYPPVLLFNPTLDSYREVLFGASSILPNIVSSCIVSLSATIITMLFAVPA